MHVPTGEILSAEKFNARVLSGMPTDDWVQVSGPPETIDRLSRSVQRDAKAQVNRKARRQAQKASRRRNR